MTDIAKLAREAGVCLQRPSDEYAGQLSRFAALVLEEAARICVKSGKLPSSMWQEPGCWQHSADCCAIAILAAKPQKSKT